MSTLDQPTELAKQESTYTDLAQIFYAAFNTGDVASLDRAFAPDWIDNNLPPGRPPGLEGLKGAVVLLRNVLPDLHCHVEDVIVAGDKVVVRSTFSGTNQGGFMGVPPTNSPVKFIAFDIHRIANGQIVESWHLEDNLSFLQQIGVVALPI